MALAAGDRDNFEGDLSLTTPTGGVTKGLMYNIGASYVVARETKDAAAAGLFAVRGPVWVKKVTGALAAGAKVYFVSSSKKVSAAATGNTLLAAVVLRAAASADDAVLVNLDGIPPTAT